MHALARTLVLALGLLLGSGLAQAFNLDLGKLVDIAKQAGNLGEIDEEREHELGADMAAKLLGARELGHVFGHWTVASSNRAPRAASPSIAGDVGSGCPHAPR